MLPAAFARFRAIWTLDFEFYGADGDNPSVACLVARELRSNTLLRRWRDELDRPPFDLGADSLFIAYYASAEWNCFLALGWRLPVYCLDLYVEFRNRTNNRLTPSGNSLLGALAFFGLSGITSAEKHDMRDLILSGGPWSVDDQQAILNYCQTDVDATARLLAAMADRIDLPRALLRGRYTQAVARMEATGTPLDTATLADLQGRWSGLQTALIGRIDRRFGVYEGTTFKRDRFERYLVGQNIPWPRLEAGGLALDDQTFKDQARSYPQLQPLRELRHTLGQMRLNKLAVGQDGRNRCLLSPFSSTSGRNQPSNAAYIFGPSCWLRSLIKPPPGYGLAYIDWSQQEFAIAGALSGDKLMLEAYWSGDPYLSFAKQAGAVPHDATKQSHKAERDQFKACVLATQYGMGELSLAGRINQAPVYARELLRLHRDTYKRFWHWSDGVEAYAHLHGKLWTVYGWTCHYGHGAKKINPRSIRNFPMQANGAEMLRLACCMATEAGIEVCAPIHDAILIQAPLHALGTTIAQAQEIMREASKNILDGFALDTDAEIVHYPDRYRDERGAEMWSLIWELLYGKPEAEAA